MNIAVVDIGKPGANFGWAMVGDTTAEGNDIEVCVQTLAAALRNGPLALGFEAPMFVPIRTDPKRLTCARKGDSGKGMPSRAILRKRRCHLTRDWTGGRVLILNTLRPLVPEATATLDWRLAACRSRMRNLRQEIFFGRSSIISSAISLEYLHTEEMRRRLPF
jgi:hypothetical protein